MDFIFYINSFFDSSIKSFLSKYKNSLIKVGLYSTYEIYNLLIDQKKVLHLEFVGGENASDGIL